MVLMPINSWSNFKTTVITTKGLNLQYTEYPNRYEIYAAEAGIFVWSISLLKDTSVDVIDFETNIKSTCNKAISSQIQPFASKILSNGKSLFKRFTGISQPLTSGSNTFSWTQSIFPWVKFLGLEVLGGELGDTCDLYVLDTSTGTYSGYPNAVLNRFAFSANIAPNYYKHISEYDADMFQNLQIKFVYNSISSKTLYINFDMNEVK